MRYKYDFSLEAWNSGSRRDVERYFAKYGWAKTLKKLIKHQGEVTQIYDFEIDQTPDYTFICYQYSFKRYFSLIELLVDVEFPFKKRLHILY